MVFPLSSLVSSNPGKKLKSSLVWSMGGIILHCVCCVLSKLTVNIYIYWGGQFMVQAMAFKVPYVLKCGNLKNYLFPWKSAHTPSSSLEARLHISIPGEVWLTETHNKTFSQDWHPDDRIRSPRRPGSLSLWRF